MGNMLFDENGELQENRRYTCSGKEFIDIFCNGDNRKDYEDAIVNIFDYAKAKGARRIFVGGSFITLKARPNDFDCVIVFNKEGDIPNFIDTSVIGNIEFDILYASEDNPKIIDSYIDLFQTYKNGIPGKPIVEVLLDSRIKEWEIRYYPSEEEAEIIKKAYTKRSVIERRKARGVLFTIHGVNTKAFWNSKFAPLACSQGWIFAPFIYKAPVLLLICPSKRKKVVEQFNDYYYEVSKKYEVTSASIVAHSFGTYIVAKYLLNHLYADFLSTPIDSIVLTGSIVNENYNWIQFFPQKIGRILNISSTNDKAVKSMPKYNWIRKYIMREKDGIFGRIGYTGIKEQSSLANFITNKEVSMLNHCNVFKDEILEGLIMPFLNANQGVCLREYIKNIRKK
mgnify:FL=1|jgi:hypothetical protein